MAIIQCKICGGEIDVPQNMTIGECPYCHEVTTFPRFDIPDIEALYRQAEDARLGCNFDKAISFYKEIIELGTADPEIYWGLVLSSWGIEYVEDPLTKERKPTCHRVQYESILDDEIYKKVIEISTGDEARIYQQEAQKISDIQKNILKISAQEKPYDIFICYKESDDSGQRTEDSVFAQGLYDKLCEQGYKVFFARVTLENKVGLYEPHIFSALNSAKVMLVVGSKKEYFEAAWVRNEWSRFLFLMRKQTEKILIPCYRNMDAYDIPKEMSMFQAQDMNKIGFTQDLLRGLNKVLGKKTEPNITDNKNRKYLIIFSSMIAVLALIIIGMLTKKSNAAVSTAPISNVQSTTLVSNVSTTVPVKHKKALALPPQPNTNPVVKKLKKYLVIDLSSGAKSSKYPVRSTDTPPDINDDKCRTSELWLRRIEPGEFIMGAAHNEVASLTGFSYSTKFKENKGEKSLPQHKVKLTQPYYIGIFEITQAQYKLVQGGLPNIGTGCDSKDLDMENPLGPVEIDHSWIRNYGYSSLESRDIVWNVGWPSCGHNVSDRSFIGRLRQRTGLLFDLPTEAQWEYACRAGTTTNLNSGHNLHYGDKDPTLDLLANYDANKPYEERMLKKVGSYKPNAWGLYDMHGNIAEECLDIFAEPKSLSDTVDPWGPFKNFNSRVYKGGDCNAYAYQCRSSSRANTPFLRGGFRLVFLPVPLRKINFGYSYDDNNCIVGVWPGFPADKAGLQKGDLILAVNDNVLSQNKIIDDFMKVKDTSVKLKFKRGDKIMTITINR